MGRPFPHIFCIALIIHHCYFCCCGFCCCCVPLILFRRYKGVSVQSWFERMAPFSAVTEEIEPCNVARNLCDFFVLFFRSHTIQFSVKKWLQLTSNVLKVVPYNFPFCLVKFALLSLSGFLDLEISLLAKRVQEERSFIFSFKILWSLQSGLSV